MSLNKSEYERIILNNRLIIVPRDVVFILLRIGQLMLKDLKHKVIDKWEPIKTMCSRGNVLQQLYRYTPSLLSASF